MNTNDAIRLAIQCMRDKIEQLAIDAGDRRAMAAQRDIRQAIARLNELKEPAVGSGLVQLGKAGNNEADIA
mgnify:CR=1 FL=1